MFGYVLSLFLLVQTALSVRMSPTYRSSKVFTAINSEGGVIAWGDNTHGGGNLQRTTAPFDVAAELSSHVISIASTHKAWAALKDDGSVVAWGSSDVGGSVSSSVDAEAELNSDVVSLFATSYAFAALKSDGSVITWGRYNSC